MAKAAAHAQALVALGLLRQGLRPAVLASPVFEADRFACHFTQALQGMWAQWCARQSA